MRVQSAVGLPLCIEPVQTALYGHAHSGTNWEKQVLNFPDDWYSKLHDDTTLNTDHDTDGSRARLDRALHDEKYPN